MGGFFRAAFTGDSKSTKIQVTISDVALKIIKDLIYVKQSDLMNGSLPSLRLIEENFIDLIIAGSKYDLPLIFHWLEYFAKDFYLSPPTFYEFKKYCDKFMLEDLG